MVGQAESISNNYIHQDYQNFLGFRQLILLTIGPITEPIAPSQAYTLAQNLCNRIPSSFRMDLPSLEIFQNMLSKLTRQRVIQQIKMEHKKCYNIILSEYGRGEFDRILEQSIANSKYEDVWVEYAQLANLAF